MTTRSNGDTKTVYIPYMCDHGYVLGAAMEVHNIPNEVLPPPDDETMALGLEFCKGRECSPCFTTTGDLLRRARQPDFDPSRSAFFVPTTTGSCRFGQYNVLQREILDQHGLDAVEFLSPSATNSYQGLGENPTRLRLLIWQGLVAVDLLQKLLHEYRPYELHPGQTDQVYQQCLERIVSAIRANGGKKLIAAMQWIAEQFAALPVDRHQRRPIIGMVGEIYLRFNAYTNQEVIRKVEAAGGEVVLASMMEWIYFTNWDYKNLTQTFGMYKDFIVTFLTDVYQQRQEHKLLKPVAHLLTYPHESPIARLMNNIRPYYDPALNSEAVLSMGKAIDFARHGISGIINVMPFSCMPGIITAGMAPRLRADLDTIPWLDIVYDSQGGTNITTRMEAFMYQAVQYQRRRTQHNKAAT